MSPWPSSRLPIRSVHSSFNFRRPCEHALIPEVGPTTVRPTNQKKDTGPTRVLLRLVCRVELAPGGLAWSRTLTPLLQNKTEISLFHSWLICFSVSHSCTLFLSIAFFFAVRANVMFISWRVQMSELNWIVLNWIEFELSSRAPFEGRQSTVTDQTVIEVDGWRRPSRNNKRVLQNSCDH